MASLRESMSTEKRRGPRTEFQHSPISKHQADAQKSAENLRKKDLAVRNQQKQESVYDASKAKGRKCFMRTW